MNKNSAWLLVASNALTAIAALALDWPIETLLWPFWIQSVIIGWFSRKRMLALRNFSTEGLTSNGKPVEATPAGARSTANFFALHYGAFHAAYFVYLWQHIDRLGGWDWAVLAGLVVSFAISHSESYRRNIAADLEGRPNLGTLLFLPYLRILPMHFTILCGREVAGNSVAALLLFTALKTLADVAMQRVEHKLLRRNAKT